MKTELVVALDFQSSSEALSLVEKLGDLVSWYKVGNELFTVSGTTLVQSLIQKNKKVFLDLKFHDIPNTVYSAVCSAAALGVQMVNVHASGGSQMLQAAARAKNEAKTGIQVLGVTVLTSFTSKDLFEIGVSKELDQQVLSLAGLVSESGLDGVVCSAQESEILKSVFPNLKLLTPGIRLKEDASGDQARVVTPEEVSRKGIDWVVVGRPITRSSSPLQTARKYLTALGREIK